MYIDIDCRPSEWCLFFKYFGSHYSRKRPVCYVSAFLSLFTFVSPPRLLCVSCVLKKKKTFISYSCDLGYFTLIFFIYCLFLKEYFSLKKSIHILLYLLSVLSVLVNKILNLCSHTFLVYPSHTLMMRMCNLSIKHLKTYELP